MTETEISVWIHGGNILDESGDNCDFAMEVSYWLDYNALEFAYKLPSNIPSGTYTYVLEQFISDEYETTYIDFIVKS